MSQQVDVGGQLIEFPDSMSADDIKSVLNQKFPPVKESFADKAKAVLGQLPGDVRATAVNAATTVPSMLAGANDLFNIGARKLGGLVGVPDKYLPSVDSTQLSQRFNQTRDLLAGRDQTNDPMASVVQGLSMPISPATGIIKAGLAASTLGIGEGGSEADRLKNAAFSFGGGAAGQGISKMITPSSAVNMQPERRWLNNLAEQEGVPLTLAQKTGSPFFERLEGRARISPYSSGAQAFDAAQQNAFNSSALAKAGSSADTALPQEMKSIQKNLGDQYAHFTGDRTVDPSLELFNAAQDIGKNLGASDFKDVSKIAKIQQGALAHAERGPTTAANLQDIRSSLSKDAYSAWKRGDNVEAQSFDRVVQGIDDAIEKSLPTDAAKSAFQGVRQQYSAFKTISRALKSGNELSAEGNIPPKALWGAIEGRTPGGVVMGTNPLSNLARIGQTMVQETPMNQGSHIGQYLDPRNLIAAKTFSLMQSPFISDWATKGRYPAITNDQEARDLVARVLRGSMMGVLPPSEQQP